jgi:DNA-binding NtrC family response regulator
VAKDLILCIDDEQLVLRVCSIAVGEAGYRVELADSGVAGLNAFASRQDDICLVVSDIVMPGDLNGIEMVERIVRIDPTVKVLMMTGYSDTMVSLQGRNRFPLIRKPFLPAELMSKIRSILNNSSDKKNGKSCSER